MEALLDDSRICKITGMAEEIKEAKELILKAMLGVDIVQKANFAAIMVILMKHFEKKWDLSFQMLMRNDMNS